MTKTFFTTDGEPDFDKMLSYIQETTDLHEPAVEISFICKVVVARALDQLAKKE